MNASLHRKEEIAAFLLKINSRSRAVKIQMSINTEFFFSLNRFLQVGFVANTFCCFALTWFGSSLSSSLAFRSKKVILFFVFFDLKETLSIKLLCLEMPSGSLVTPLQVFT